MKSKASQAELDQLRNAITMACQPSSMPPIGKGRRLLLDLPRTLVLDNVVAVAKESLDLSDEWEFRRLIEALSLVRAVDALSIIVRQGLADPDKGVAEAANDWIDIGMVWPPYVESVREWFPPENPRTWNDISDGFAFFEDSLVYYDAPLAGFVRCSSSGGTLAFRCLPIVQDQVWQWILVPSRELQEDPAEITDAGLAELSSYWISVIEDIRSRVRLFSAACPADPSNSVPPWTK